MAALTRLGYEVKWTGPGCKINSPDGAQLPVQLDQGCPTLPRREGACILQQVEDHQRRETQMKLAAIRPNVELPKACPEVEVVKRLKAIFPEVPADLVKEILGYAEVDMNQVVFNRHHRRKVQRAKTLVVPRYTSSQEMIRSSGWHTRKMVLSSPASSSRRALTFETAICMGGWNNWQ